MPKAWWRAASATWRLRVQSSAGYARDLEQGFALPLDWLAPDDSLSHLGSARWIAAQVPAKSIVLARELPGRLCAQRHVAELRLVPLPCFIGDPWRPDLVRLLPPPGLDGLVVVAADPSSYVRRTARVLGSFSTCCSGAWAGTTGCSTGQARPGEMAGKSAGEAPPQEACDLGDLAVGGGKHAAHHDEAWVTPRHRR